MASRFYLQQPNSGIGKASGFSGTWDDISQANPTKFMGAKSGTNTAVTGTSTGTPIDEVVMRYISLPLVNQTLFATTDTLQWIIAAIASSTANSTWVFKVHALILMADFTTVRGTLSNNFVGSTAFTTTSTGRGDGAQNLSNNVTGEAGDRIWMEIGYRRGGSNTGARSATFRFGGTQATDLTNGSTNTTTEPGWVEFSNTFSVAAAIASKNLSALGVG